MLFNSFTFAVSIALLLPAYFALRRLDLQSYLLLGASHLFHRWWDWRFLGLIAGPTRITIGRYLPIVARPNSALLREAGVLGTGGQ